VFYLTLLKFVNHIASMVDERNTTEDHGLKNTDWWKPLSVTQLPIRSLSLCIKLCYLWNIVTMDISCATYSIFVF
jgi:hypothetical protein